MGVDCIAVQMIRVCMHDCIKTTASIEFCFLHKLHALMILNLGTVY